MKMSPCYDCPRKNYAAGCAKNCEERDKDIAERKERIRKVRNDHAPVSVLVDSQRKHAKKKN